MNYKNYLIFFILFFQLSPSFAQKVDTVTYNQEKYFVYPYKKEFSPHDDLLYALKKRKFVKSFYKLTVGDHNFSKTKIVNIKHHLRCDKRLYSQFFSTRYSGFRYKKAIRKNYDPFLNVTYNLFFDLTPNLDTLPDGIYIQYFNDFICGDSKGKIHIVKNKVAGIFQIQNNLLNGKAMWFNIHGDTLKKGNFKNGLKEGKWYLETHKISYNFSQRERYEIIKNNVYKIDTTIEKITYFNGSKNGSYSCTKIVNINSENVFYQEGFYRNEKSVGTWIEKESKRSYSKTSNQIHVLFDKYNLTLTKKYVINESDSISKNYLIRPNLIIPSFSYDTNYNFFPHIRFPNSLRQYYEINYSTKEWNEIGRDYGCGYADVTIQKWMQNEIIDKNENSFKHFSSIVDKYGIKIKFKDDLENYYPNGQLMYKIHFNSDNTIQEDTIFWDNGKPFDILTNNKDYNNYRREIYDYDGKIYYDVIYNYKGEVLQIKHSPFQERTLLIDNVIGKYEYDYIHYNCLVDFDLFQKDSVLISKNWFLHDSTASFVKYFLKNEQKLFQINYSITGKIIDKKELFFDIANSHIILTELIFFDDFCFEQKRILEKDSMNILTILNDENFSDEFIFKNPISRKLYKNNELFTGEIEMHFGKRYKKIEKENKIIYRFPLHINEIKHFKKYSQNSQYRKKLLIDYNQSFLLENIEMHEAINRLFSPNFYLIEIGNYYDRKGNQKFKFLNGEATGKWQIKTIRKEKYIIDYRNNQINGQVIYKLNKNLFFYKTIAVENYKNDTLNGENWKVFLKEKIKSFYINGQKEGDEIEVFKNYVFKKTYKNDLLNGPMTVYEKNEKTKDSILRYNAFFENGVLSGDAIFLMPDQTIKFELKNHVFKQYDTNHLLLNEVILDDNRVKEENHFLNGFLDVKYQFDLKDFIFFRPSVFYDIDFFSIIEGSWKSLEENYLYGTDYEFDNNLVNKNFHNYKMIKYYPNNNIAREGDIVSKNKVGLWKYYAYEGKKLYEILFQDSLVIINDSIKFNSSGILYLFDTKDEILSKSFIIENSEKFDCANNDYYAIRQYHTFWEQTGSNRINGYVKNYYDNGVIQSEGIMKDGLPSGVWKYYDPYGKLNQVGTYIFGKKEGRWITGDLGKIKYLGDICLNPNLPDLEKIIAEKMNNLDIQVAVYFHGIVLNAANYELNNIKN
ncbi:MAG: hypothetical protein HYR91_09940 [Flavobacteriia bacterium]|nr:hypothetical protein [Flavobacteriia bacterium]